MSKILYIFLLGSCLSQATYLGRAPRAMPTGDPGLGFIPTRDAGTNPMPSGLPLSQSTQQPTGTQWMSMITGTSDDADETSSVSTSAPDENESVAIEFDYKPSFDEILNNANIRFRDNEPYYSSSQKYVNPIKPFRRTVRVKLRGEIKMKIDFKPIWAPTDIITMPKDVIKEKILEAMSKKQDKLTRKKAQKKSRARRVVRETPDMQNMKNMRDIGLF